MPQVLTAAEALVSELVSPGGYVTMLTDKGHEVLKTHLG